MSRLRSYVLASALVFLFSLSGATPGYALESPASPRGTEVAQSLVKWQWLRVPGASFYEVRIDGEYIGKTEDPQFFSYNLWAGEHSMSVRAVSVDDEVSAYSATAKIRVAEWFDPRNYHTSYLVNYESPSLPAGQLAAPPSDNSESSIDGPNNVNGWSVDNTTIRWEWERIEGAHSYDVHVNGGYSGTTIDNFFESPNLARGGHFAKIMAKMDDGRLSQFSESTWVVLSEQRDDTEAEDANTEQANTAIVSPPIIVATRYPESDQFIRSVGADYNRQTVGYLETRDGFESNFDLTRITSNSVFGVSNGSARHSYSKRQPWNSDQSLMEIAGRIINADTYNIVSRYMPLTSERVWSNTVPELMYGIVGTSGLNSFSSFNVKTGEIDRKIQLDGFQRCTIGAAEGEMSLDDRYVLLSCTNSSGSIVLLSIDIQNARIIGRLAARYNYNWAGFSQSGEYIVVENNRYPDSNPQLYVYDKTLSNPRLLGRPEHGDFGFDANGDEVYAMIDYDVVRYIRLRDSAEFELGISNMSNPIGNGHLSCRNIWRKGWCYFSSIHSQWLGAVYLSDSDNVMEHWGYHRSSQGSYYSQPHAVPNRSGDKLLFTSDWYGNAEISDYVISVK